MCLQQPIPRSKSLYLRFQQSQSPRASHRCHSFPCYSGQEQNIVDWVVKTNTLIKDCDKKRLDCFNINENPSRSPLLTEGFHDDNSDYYESHQPTMVCDGSNSSESRLLSVSIRACTDYDKLGNRAVGSDVFNPSMSSLHCIDPYVDSDYEELDNVGSDVLNPSGSLLPRSSPHANTNLARVGGCVSSNPSGDVAISFDNSHGENTDFDQAHSRPRVTHSEWIFILIGLGLEILSAGFDQVSSPRKPLYALVSLLLAITAVFTCILELIHGRMKEKDKDGSPNSMVHRSLPDIFGLGLAVIQCVCSAVQYDFLHQQTSNPMKLSPVPLFFFSCLVVLKLKTTEGSCER
ncbi:hypothetical protein D8674_038745 [Pyrus ussuriensis x Pyrus communis]|uniref:Uncharacterized protein n=1 Tax=Pyrus ussuriensis x Pyrus communis TaxID=2448454 RepID=A0A5N5FM55_9ROSA|nr:hypothetical protein D8674_038745 [Pyrus ussuriensis x Pyrus communis]